MTDKVLACFETTAYLSRRGTDTLRTADATTVATTLDIAAQLKEMW